MSVLDDIIAGVLLDLEQRMLATPSDQVRAQMAEAAAALPVLPLFSGSDVGVIAEIKRSSPSKGELAAIPRPALLAAQYEIGGASAISVLTEERRFGGSLADLGLTYPQYLTLLALWESEGPMAVGDISEAYRCGDRTGAGLF